MYKFAPLALALIAGVSAVPYPPGQEGPNFGGNRQQGSAEFRQGGNPGFQGGNPNGGFTTTATTTTATTTATATTGTATSTSTVTPNGNGIPWTATFDDIGNGGFKKRQITNIAATIAGLGLGGTTIGPYDGLYWGGWMAATSANGAAQQTQPQPHSGDRFAYATTNDNSMTTRYPGGVIGTFDLESMYLACSGAGTAFTSAVCQLEVVGSSAGVEVARQEVTYAVNPATGITIPNNAGADGSNMIRVDFTNFTNVDLVRIQAYPAGTTLDVFVDDVTYIVYPIN